VYVKLFSAILDSSIWDENHATVRLWIAMLAMADRTGVVTASFGGLVSRARVTREEGKRAVEVLEAPDPESKDQDYGGRRIERIDGGWLVLNYQKYRDLQDADTVRSQTRERVRRHRERKRSVTPGNAPLRYTEAEAEAESSSVPSVPAHAPAAEPTWNTILAPLVREHLVPRHPPDWSEARDLSIARNALKAGVVLEDLADAIRGLPLLVQGSLTLKLLYAASGGQMPLLQRAAHRHRETLKQAPRSRGLRQLGDALRDVIG
jgi:hypothetical protein